MRYECGECHAVIEVAGADDFTLDALRRSTFNRMVKEHDALHPSTLRLVPRPDPTRLSAGRG